ncbi:MAG: hypothetical protein ACFFAK_10710 [Promethearchaeota archaeon]
MEAKGYVGIVVLIIGILLLIWGISFLVTYQSSIHFSLLRGIGYVACFVGGCLSIIGLCLLIFGRKKN